MGWPEAVLGIASLVQVAILTWLATRQQQVKRALNGNTAHVTGELAELRQAVEAAAAIASRTERLRSIRDAPSDPMS
jgi:hypothetical protein